MESTKLLTLTGPSAVGKTTLANGLVENYSDFFCHAVAFTTRKPRDGELNKKDYYFFSQEEFEEKRVKGELLRHAEVHGNFYGHSKAEMQRIQEEQKIGIAIPDLTGVQRFKLQQEIPLDVKSVLILPESYISLGKRLLERNTDRKADNATKERWHTGWKDFVDRGRELGVYDFEVVNETNKIQQTVDEIIHELKNRNFLNIDIGKD